MPRKKKKGSGSKPSHVNLCAKCSQDINNLKADELKPLKKHELDKVSSKQKENKPKVLFDTPDANAMSELDSESDDNDTKYNPALAIPVSISDTDKYDMSRKLNGCAIIFNFEQFQNKKKYPNRDGSTADVKRLCEVFKQRNIDFKERVYENLSFNLMAQRLNEFKTMNSLLANSNCLIVVILSHGEMDDMIMAVDHPFKLYDIIDKFSPEQLPEMAARPKIFLVQACRGKKIDSGSIMKREVFTFDQPDSASDETPFKYPNHADLCIAFSSHHEHFSYRNSDGSWFIQEFCNTFEKVDLKENNLLDILTTTNREVAKRNTSSDDVRFDDKKQISSFYSTFTQKFYFDGGK